MEIGHVRATPAYWPASLPSPLIGLPPAYWPASLPPAYRPASRVPACFPGSFCYYAGLFLKWPASFPLQTVSGAYMYPVASCHFRPRWRLRRPLVLCLLCNCIEPGSPILRVCLLASPERHVRFTQKASSPRGRLILRSAQNSN